MHIITRKKYESIVIDGEITITVIDIREDKVRLGIQCPPGVTVHRKEVYGASSAVDPDDGGMHFVDIPVSDLKGMEEITLNQLIHRGDDN